MARATADTSRKSHYLREWRKARGLTQEALADMIGVDRTVISKVETEKLPYSQTFLERVALVLGCHPADVLTGPPDEAETLTSLWRSLATADRKKALAILRAFMPD
jgi:transcriptional regulator with XRE-family HTH domain